MQILRSYSRPTGAIHILTYPWWLWYMLKFENHWSTVRFFWAVSSPWVYLWGSRNTVPSSGPFRPWYGNGFPLLLNPECPTLPCWFLNLDPHLLNSPFIKIFLVRLFLSVPSVSCQDPNWYSKWYQKTSQEIDFQNGILGLGCSYVCWVHKPPCMGKEDTSDPEHEEATPSLKTITKWGAVWDADGGKDIRR